MFEPKKGLLTQESCLMHEFLGDAAYVDAGATKTPGGSLWCRDDEIEKTHFGAEAGGVLSTKNRLLGHS